MGPQVENSTESTENCMLDCEQRSSCQKKKQRFFSQSEVTRASSILLSRLRCGNADLNSNLFSRCHKEDPACNCGAIYETTEHFLFKCPLYTKVRSKITHSANAIYFNLSTLMNGNPYLSDDNLEKIYVYVQEYIINTGIFDM